MRNTILFKKDMEMIIISPVMKIYHGKNDDADDMVMMTRTVKCNDEKPRIYILQHRQASIG